MTLWYVAQNQRTSVLYSCVSSGRQCARDAYSSPKPLLKIQPTSSDFSNLCLRYRLHSYTCIQKCTSEYIGMHVHIHTTFIKLHIHIRLNACTYMHPYRHVNVHMCVVPPTFAAPLAAIIMRSSGRQV
jgi:hypothetical protein